MKIARLDTINPTTKNTRKVRSKILDTSCHSFLFSREISWSVSMLAMLLTCFNNIVWRVSNFSTSDLQMQLLVSWTKVWTLTGCWAWSGSLAVDSSWILFFRDLWDPQGSPCLAFDSQCSSIWVDSVALTSYVESHSGESKQIDSFKLRSAPLVLFFGLYNSKNFFVFSSASSSIFETSAVVKVILASQFNTMFLTHPGILSKLECLQ